MKLTILGSAAAIPSISRDNVSFILSWSESEQLLIDCPGSPVVKILKAGSTTGTGYDYKKIKKIILTHSHVDHIYGLPSLIHALYGEHEPIDLWAPSDTIKMISEVLKIMRLDDAKKFPMLKYNALDLEMNKIYKLIEDTNLVIEATEAAHTRPTLALRIFSKVSQKAVVLSGDTAPSEQVQKLAYRAHLLIHDCNAPHRYQQYFGNAHTSALELGRLAKSCEVENLIPIHFNTTLEFSMNEIMEEIRQNYKGNVHLAYDFMGWDF